jgi:hypothetical protein
VPPTSMTRMSMGDLKLRNELKSPGAVVGRSKLCANGC